MFSLQIFTNHIWVYISWKWTCLIEIWITWFQKELAIPQFQIPHEVREKNIILQVEFGNSTYSPKERITNFQAWNFIFQMVGWKIWAPFRTTKVCSPNWDFAKYSFVQVLNSHAGGQSSNPARELCYIFTVTSLGAPVRSRAQAS